MVYLGGLFGGDEFHAHFVGTPGQLSQDPFSVTFLKIVLARVGVFLALGQHGVDQPRQFVGRRGNRLGLHRHRFHATAREPICQRVEVRREAGELAYRLIVPVWRYGTEVRCTSDIMSMTPPRTMLARGRFAPLLHRISAAPHFTLPQLRRSGLLRRDFRQRADCFPDLSIERTSQKAASRPLARRSCRALRMHKSTLCAAAENSI